jgi:hypothetical protein
MLVPANVDVWWCERGGPTSTPKRGDSVIVRASKMHDLTFAPGTIPVIAKVDMLIEIDDPDSSLPEGPMPNRPC